MNENGTVKLHGPKYVKPVDTTTYCTVRYYPIRVQTKLSHLQTPTLPTNIHGKPTCECTFLVCAPCAQHKQRHRDVMRNKTSCRHTKEAFLDVGTPLS